MSAETVNDGKTPKSLVRIARVGLALYVLRFALVGYGHVVNPQFGFLKRLTIGSAYSLAVSLALPFVIASALHRSIHLKYALENALWGVTCSVAVGTLTVCDIHSNLGQACHMMMFILPLSLMGAIIGWYRGLAIASAAEPGRDESGTAT